MKLLYISSDPTISTSKATGAATHILSVIKGLQKLGICVEPLIAGDEYLSNRKISRSCAIKKYFPLAARTLKRDISYLIHDYLWTRKIIQVAKSFKPDIIYERLAFLHSSGVRLSKKLNIPILIEKNSPVTEIKSMGGSLLLPIALYIEKHNLLSADAIITISNVMKNYLVNQGANISKIYVVCNAAHKETIKFNSHNLINKSDSHITVGHVSSFASWYKLDTLIEAFAIAKESYPNLSLLLIGDGPLRKDLELFAKKLNISDSVIFRGEKKQGEVLDILANYVDIAVCANINWYGSPTKIFEYGATGKPVIAFWTPAIAEIIEHEKTGLLVSSKSPNELSSAIIRLIDNPGLRFELAKNWQKKVLEEHTWDLVALKTLDICKKVLAGELYAAKLL